MNQAIAETHSTSQLLRRALQAGFVLFLAKGCAWLVAVWLVRDLL